MSGSGRRASLLPDPCAAGRVAAATAHHARRHASDVQVGLTDTSGTARKKCQSRHIGVKSPKRHLLSSETNISGRKYIFAGQNDKQNSG
jgi:hypothetical protein